MHSIFKNWCKHYAGLHAEKQGDFQGYKNHVRRQQCQQDSQEIGFKASHHYTGSNQKHGKHLPCPADSSETHSIYSLPNPLLRNQISWMLCSRSPMLLVTWTSTLSTGLALLVLFVQSNFLWSFSANRIHFHSGFSFGSSSWPPETPRMSPSVSFTPPCSCIQKCTLPSWSGLAWLSRRPVCTTA